MLLPPSLRDWVPEDHPLYFVIDAVEQLDLRSARVNERASGSEQYPPATMRALLVYSYATGTFGSRRIERTTFDNVAVSFLCSDTHPNHDLLPYGRIGSAGKTARCSASAASCYAGWRTRRWNGRWYAAPTTSSTSTS